MGRMENRDLWSELNIAFCIQLVVLRVNRLVARFLEKISLSKTNIGQQSYKKRMYLFLNFESS